MAMAAFGECYGVLVFNAEKAEAESRRVIHFTFNLDKMNFPHHPANNSIHFSLYD
jgi:hypothetical protein